MKSKLVAILAISSIYASSASASWVYADNGKALEACCHKARVVVKKKVEPEVCLTCDYSKFQMAKLEPIGSERLQPAILKNCGMKK